MGDKKFYPTYLKPFFDIIGACALLIVVSPVLMLCMILLVFVNKGHVFFHQERTGLHGNTFGLIKFRSMLAKEVDGEMIQESTGFGKVLRKLSIDELPQLFNVLKGEMSMVGPRPLLPEYLPYYNEQEEVRHQVKPGITGWAQVNGRNRSDWGKRMIDDRFYVENISFWLDLRILFSTVTQVFKVSEADFETGDQETFTEFAKRRNG